MNNDTAVILLGIAIILVISIVALLYGLYDQYSKSSNVKTSNKYSFNNDKIDNAFEHLDKRVTRLELTTDNILKDIAAIKRRINF